MYMWPRAGFYEARLAAQPGAGTAQSLPFARQAVARDEQDCACAVRALSGRWLRGG